MSFSPAGSRGWVLALVIWASGSALAAERTSRVATGSIRVFAEAGRRVYVDGKVVGNTDGKPAGKVIGSIPPGTRIIRVEKNVADRKFITVEVVAGKVTDVHAENAPPPAPRAALNPPSGLVGSGPPAKRSGEEAESGAEGSTTYQSGTAGSWSDLAELVQGYLGRTDIESAELIRATETEAGIEYELRVVWR